MNEIKMNEIKMLIPFGIGALNTEENVIISEHTNLLKRAEGFVAKEFLDLEYGNMFCIVDYDISFGMKIPLTFHEGRCYNCIDLECGELGYIPEYENVCIYTQLCIKTNEY